MLSLPSPEPSQLRPLRVGYVLKKYPRLSETFVLNELLGLEAAGIEVHVFSTRLPTDGRFHMELARFRGPVTYLPEVGGAATVDAMETLASGSTDARDLQAAVRFARRLPEARRADVLIQGLALADASRSARIDHLHAHFATVASHTAHVAHLLSGVSYSVTAHAKDIWRAGLDPNLFAEVATAARAVITVCEPAREHVGRVLAPAATVTRVYNGFPLDELDTLDPQVRRERSLVLAVGRLVEKKGFGVLLEATADLAAAGIGTDVVIVGEGDGRADLARRIGELGLEDRVRLTGALPRDEIFGLMRRARFLVAPYVTGDDGNQDALPTVVIEAMACGLPVVTTPIGGVPEMVTDGVEGLLVPSGDPKALALAMARILADDGLSAELGAAGPAKVAARFDRNKTLPELISIFDGSHPDLSRQLVEGVTPTTSPTETAARRRIGTSFVADSTAPRLAAQT